MQSLSLCMYNNFSSISVNIFLHCPTSEGEYFTTLLNHVWLRAIIVSIFLRIIQSCIELNLEYLQCFCNINLQHFRYSNKSASGPDGPYNPQPINTSSVQLNNDLNNIVQQFSEHYHDAWASRKLENGWRYGESYSGWDGNKTHPRLKPYSTLSDYERER